MSALSRCKQPRRCSARPPPTTESTGTCGQDTCWGSTRSCRAGAALAALTAGGRSPGLRLSRRGLSSPCWPSGSAWHVCETSCFLPGRMFIFYGNKTSTQFLNFTPTLICSDDLQANILVLCAPSPDNSPLGLEQALRKV